MRLGELPARNRYRCTFPAPQNSKTLMTSTAPLGCTPSASAGTLAQSRAQVFVSAMKFIQLSLVIAALSATPTAAVAQSGWGTSMSGQPPSMNSYQSIDPDWERCINEDHEFAFDEAVAGCTHVIEHPDSNRWLIAAALYYRSSRYEDEHQDEQAAIDLRQAAQIYAAYINEDEHDPRGYINRASINARLENYDEALTDYDHAISLNHESVSALVGRAQTLFRRADYAGAVESYDRASRLGARNEGVSPEVYAGKCAARTAARTDLDEARRFCNRAVSNSRSAPWALVARGYFRVMQGRLDDAASDFARALERDARYAPALYGRGAVAVRQGRVAEGEADMTRATEMNRRQVNFYANAGLRP